MKIFDREFIYYYCEPEESHWHVRPIKQLKNFKPMIFDNFS